jgi:hypothetical protein
MTCERRTERRVDDRRSRGGGTGGHAVTADEPAVDRR